MTRACRTALRRDPEKPSIPALARRAVLFLLAFLLTGGLLRADAAAPSGGGESFGQYVVRHQDILGPFFSDNIDDFFRLGVPVVLGMLGWVIVITMLVGWIIDVLLSRGFSFFFAPAFADIKRSVIYATGQLVLSVVYTFLFTLALLFSLKFSFVFLAAGIAIVLLVAIAFAAQVVWILYLYRTPVNVSIAFYLVLLLVHGALGGLVARTIVGSNAAATVADFENSTIVPRLQQEIQSTRQELADAQAARDATRQKYANLQGEVSQREGQEGQLRQAIEAKKVSDIYVYSRILQAYARGELVPARDQLAAFLAKFPASPLVPRARTQLNQLDEAIAAQNAQKKQADALAAADATAARADLLARAGRGQVTLSEMRAALIGKSRAQVSGLLGPPAQTDTDSWGYAQQMIYNPLTNENFGLLVYFSEGLVQGVDYNRNTVAR